MRAAVGALLALGLLCALPAAASARPCSDRVPVIVKGVQWIVFTGDSARERREIPCSKARRIAKRKLAPPPATLAALGSSCCDDGGQRRPPRRPSVAPAERPER